MVAQGVGKLRRVGNSQSFPIKGAKGRLGKEDRTFSWGWTYSRKIGRRGEDIGTLDQNLQKYGRTLCLIGGFNLKPTKEMNGIEGGAGLRRQEEAQGGQSG